MMIQQLFENVPDPVRKARAVTLGIFDGVHRGHQAILAKLLKIDPNENLVITFNPHPDEILWNRQIHWIHTPKERNRYLHQYGAKNIVELPFTKELSQLKAYDFAEALFLKILNRPSVVVGYDLRFGYQAQGNFEFLKENFSSELEVTKIAPVGFEERPISSTRVREAVLIGELDRAKQMLGRDFTTQGEVIHGYNRGRQLGFPTANIQIEKGRVLPPFGVYSVRVRGLDQERRAVANLGIRPTFEDSDEPQLEVHIPDFSLDIYGKDLEVVWDRFLRPEKRFSSKDELITQIQCDVKMALHDPE